MRIIGTNFQKSMIIGTVVHTSAEKVNCSNCSVGGMVMESNVHCAELAVMFFIVLSSILAD